MVKKNSFGKMIMKTTALAIIAMFLLGFAFPTITALITQEIDPNSATGSPVKIDGKVYGSYLLAEAFNSSIFFQARPSGIGFNLSESGGPSYSIDSGQLLNQTKTYLKDFEQENNLSNASQIPEAMIAYSGSGLDPNIPLQGAIDQIDRIAANLSVITNGSFSYADAQNFVVNITASDVMYNFPIFGSPYVNTVTLNFEIIDKLMQSGFVQPSFLD
ncbi:MAG: potassium-transporting ATPase subunit C [Candidatus Thermoplasmatota archaeon]|nr:potassium-transporting ATPase subunit C [Candidatus Thermoplasmatota archaeon]